MISSRIVCCKKDEIKGTNTSAELLRCQFFLSASERSAQAFFCCDGNHLAEKTHKSVKSIDGKQMASDAMKQHPPRGSVRNHYDAVHAGCHERRAMTGFAEREKRKSKQRKSDTEVHGDIGRFY